MLAFPSTAGAVDWTEADKDGYGTSTTRASKVWHTLDDGRLTEVLYPDLGTPSVKTLEFAVSGKRGATELDTNAAGAPALSPPRRRGLPTKIMSAGPAARPPLPNSA